jgi:DNA-binding transcriptional MerR regulator
MHYTIDELAKASNVSQRSIYTYAQRHLIPPGLKGSRGFTYTDEHLEALRLIRALVRLGLPLRQIEGLVVGRERGEMLKVVGPVLPLIKLLEETENRVTELQRRVSAPDPEELDLSNLGLEDPVSLRHKLAEAERQQDRLKREFEIAGAEVIRELISSSLTSVMPSDSTVHVGSNDEAAIMWLQLKAFEDRISRQLGEMQAEIEQIRHESELRAFTAGLMAAYDAGWQPDSAVLAPKTLDTKLVDAFQVFVKSRPEARPVPKP